jgi:hypothetical protein
MKNPIFPVDDRSTALYYGRVIAPRWISLRASGGVILYSQEVELCENAAKHNLDRFWRISCFGLRRTCRGKPED